uniref:Uncharacterized protein n=1 Tax=Tanacetum cinerariifolium TaxID=118510 RepID=A0A699LD93_TANCI|nr:hypothetical protein [Tanacetum cinerariifolium]
MLIKFSSKLKSNYLPFAKPNSTDLSFVKHLSQSLLSSPPALQLFRGPPLTSNLAAKNHVYVHFNSSNGLYVYEHYVMSMIIPDDSPGAVRRLPGPWMVLPTKKNRLEGDPRPEPRDPPFDGQVRIV